MHVDRKELDDQLRGFKAKQNLVPEQVRNLHLVHQAQVPANLLMGDENWRIYQQQIAGAIERMDGIVETLLAKLSSPTLVSHDAILQVKIALAEAQATAHAWRVMLELPKQIVADASKAAEYLDSIGEKYEQA